MSVGRSVGRSVGQSVGAGRAKDRTCLRLASERCRIRCPQTLAPQAPGGRPIVPGYRPAPRYDARSAPEHLVVPAETTRWGGAPASEGVRSSGLFRCPGPVRGMRKIGCMGPGSSAGTGGQRKVLTDGHRELAADLFARLIRSVKGGEFKELRPLTSW